MSYVSDNFKVLCDICECIARQFGEDCEVVLHDLTKPYENTVVAIWNGHVTGRKVGDGGTDAGLAILRGTANPKDEYCYINTAPNGHILKSTSKYFVDENGKVVGSLCINYDITNLMKGQIAIEKFTSKNESRDEIFTGNVDEILEILMEKAVESTGKTIDVLDKEDKVEIIKYLDEKGAFLIKKSAERVAEYLDISRFTVYNYLNETKEE